ncbi:hypothetical protein Salat_2899900 [Sesamum alatum]|uniref:Uncharacterized protein n=1 Tax=Sesamum alatum TaxID=300844 RepID=A0AAE1XJF9_9LAMI|nr:hypothetical protein Salat_2899900 [Sesamum alatum]
MGSRLGDDHSHRVASCLDWALVMESSLIHFCLSSSVWRGLVDFQDKVIQAIRNLPDSHFDSLEHDHDLRALLPTALRKESERRRSPPPPLRLAMHIMAKGLEKMVVSCCLGWLRAS